MFPYPKVQYKGQISTHSEDRSDQHYKNMKLCWRQSRTLLSLLEDTSRLVGRMKLLAFCGFLFVFLLCLSAFAAEGRNVKKGCCLKLTKMNRKVHKGTHSRMTPMQIRKCKPCAAPRPLFAPGPLPQLK